MCFPPRRPSRHMPYRSRLYLARCRSYSSIVFFNVSAKSPTSPIGKIFHANSIRLLVRLLLIQHRARNTFSRDFRASLAFNQQIIHRRKRNTRPVVSCLVQRFGTLSQSAQAAYPATCILLIYLPLSGYSAPPYKSENTSVSFIRHDGYLEAVCSVSVWDGFWQE